MREHFPAAIILRPSVVFGPEDDFFNRFAAMARFSPALPLIGGGKTRFQPVYVGDVADAAVAAVAARDARASPARPIELGGPRIYSFKELMELLLAEIGRAPAAAAGALAHRPPAGRGPGPAAQAAADPRPGEAAAAATTCRAASCPGLHRARHRPDGPEAILPTYLDRFRVGGRFARA